MKLNLKGTGLNISFYFAAAVTLILILDKSGTAAMALAACIIHECGHLICLLFFGEIPVCVSFEVFGMRIDRGNTVRLSLKQEIAAALAGPLANILLALLSFFCAVVFGNEGLLKPAVINLLIAAFNLLPVEPLDGNKTLYFFLCLHKDEAQAAKITRTASSVVLFPVAAAGFYVLIKSGYNFTLLAAAGYLILLLVLKADE